MRRFIVVKGARKFYKSFIEFINKGNIVQLAIGLSLGSAFTAVVNSLVNDIMMPLVGAITAGLDFSQLSFHLPSIVHDQTVTIAYGKFINTIITFLILGLCLFIFIKVFDRIFRKKELVKEETVKPIPEPSSEEKLLTEILMELKKK